MPLVNWVTRPLQKCASLVLIGVSLALLLAFGFGEIRGMRVAERIPEEQLRFDSDLKLTYEQSLQEIKKRQHETDAEFAYRLTTVIQDSIAHLGVWTEHDPDKYFQRVPFIENPALYLLGKYSGLPQIERYHFSDYRRTLERGIGLCGDHAIVLSSILDKYGIENTLLSARAEGHVVVEARFNDGSYSLLDSDFGIVAVGHDRLDFGAPSLLQLYADAGYSDAEQATLADAYSSGFVPFESTYKFMAKRYIFERVTYVLKWAIPIGMLVCGIYLLHQGKRRDRTALQFAPI